MKKTLYFMEIYYFDNSHFGDSLFFFVTIFVSSYSKAIASTKSETNLNRIHFAIGRVENSFSANSSISRSCKASSHSSSVWQYFEQCIVLPYLYVSRYIILNSSVIESSKIFISLNEIWLISSQENCRSALLNLM